MPSPDANVLVSAFLEDATHHDRCRERLLAAMFDREQTGLPELVLSGVARADAPAGVPFLFRLQQAGVGHERLQVGFRARAVVADHFRRASCPDARRV